MGRMPTTHRYLEMIGAPNQGQKRILLDVGVRLLQAAKNLRSGADTHIPPVLQVTCSYIGDDVSEAVNFHDASNEPPFFVTYQWMVETDQIVDAGSEPFDRHPSGQMGGRGGENIPPVKGTADGFAHDTSLDNRAGFDGRVFLKEARQHAVVGTDKHLAAGSHRHRPARASDARVYDDDMDGIIREIPAGFRDKHGGFHHILRPDVMREVKDSAVRADTRDDALHRGYIGIPRAEIGGKGHEGRSVHAVPATLVQLRPAALAA